MALLDIFWAENQLVKSLPKNDKSSYFRKVKHSHRRSPGTNQDTCKQLKQIFELLGEDAIAKKCDAMEGLTKEGEGIVESTEEGTATRDVGIILASQKIEHYEIATYGGLAQLATTLGLDDVAELLSETLSEEKEADMLLTEIAENEVNYKASEEA